MTRLSRSEENVAAEPRYGLGFRLTVGFFALLSGLIMFLWATQEDELWKYLPAAFCFCVAGAVLLPRKLALACGYVIATSVLAWSAWVVYLGVTTGENLWKTLRFAEEFGLPAAAFLLYRRLPGQRAPRDNPPAAR